jgi:uncharacterized protein (DUF983 family)
MASCLRGILRQRCPHCREGRMFRGLFTMNDPCPVCGLLFEREEGYFMGAMYVSYGLSSALLVPLYFIATALLPEWSTITIALLLWVPYLPFVPLVFRYSRVLWIYFDRHFWPQDSFPSAYERFREQQRALEKARGNGVLTPRPPAS